MGRSDYLQPGVWNALCDSCGEKLKSTALRRRWDGFLVCERCWEPRQPQDFVRGAVDQQAPPWTRPVPEEQFEAFCTLDGQLSIAGYSIAGCWVSGRPKPPGFDPLPVGPTGPTLALDTTDASQNLAILIQQGL